MKKILITGSDSYIGTSFERYITRWPEKYHINTIDMRGNNWKQVDFSGYDTVFHVAGIAHSNAGKLSKADKDIYYRVNTELAIETAKKAKADGVKQFIFMSSAIVYGESSPIGMKKIISKDSKPSPSNFYGDSKLKAEEGILPLQNEEFIIVILRPPMIYGKGSKGNYPILSKFARILPFFPEVDNQRSVLYIENLCELVRQIIERSEKGVFCPQNERVVSTNDLVSAIARAHKKRIVLFRGMTGFLSLFRGIRIINKAFGSFSYEMDLSEISNIDYRVVDFESSIMRTEL